MPKQETLSFNADVAKVLRLMIHSIYQHKDIFLRELISNASDACDRLRYLALTRPELTEEGSDYAIRVLIDKKAGTLTIADNGIGMPRAEMIKNLGTIAGSGTQQFLEKLTGDGKKDMQLIGQFGIGFYAAFMVADKVTVLSRAAGKKTVQVWESCGDGTFTVAEAEEERGRGTSVILHLKKEEKEYLDPWRTRHIVETYSNHIAFPILLADENGKEERINSGTAIWLRPKSEVTDEEYKAFYRDMAHLGVDEPWLTLHSKLEGTLEYSYLLYVPGRPPFDLFHPDRKRSVKLYVQRVFIADEGVDIIPPYLRFLRGVIDSADLPLNISRETLQHNLVVQKIRRSVTKKVLGEMAEKAEKDPESYVTFWKHFGPVLKEGLCDGKEPIDEIMKACRFTSLLKEKLISMKECVESMKEEQGAIYYLTADSLETAKANPQLEGFRARGWDVLLLTDSVDDFWVTVQHEYQGKELKSVTRAEIESEEEKARGEEKKNDKKIEALVAYIKSTLGEAVREVRATAKLTDSPVCLAVPVGGMDMRMERFLVENKQLLQRSAKILEINPKHSIIKKLAEDFSKEGDSLHIADAVHLLFAQASIIEGENIADLGAFARRMNALLEKALVA